MKNVLVLPGGGIRGYVQSEFLARLEDAAGESVLSMFDLVVGTSTGGILAVALGLGRAPRVISDMYEEHGPDIFHRSWWSRITNPRGLRAPKYSSKPLEQAIRGVVGESRFEDMMVDTMVTSYNFTDANAILLKSWKPHKFFLNYQMCMATSAAPTYFPPYAIGNRLFLDGGVHANNPASIAATEAEKRWGVGSYRVLVVNNGHEASPGPDETPGWGLLGWAPHIATVFMDSGYDIQGYIGQRLTGSPRFMEVGPNGLNVPMDDASPDAFRTMSQAVRDMVASGQDRWAADFLT